ncbi:lipocalin family protein [Sphingobacterium sp. HJSM2_6]
MNKKKSLVALAAVALGTVAYNYLKPVRSKVDVVKNFDIARYLGHWHEIARIDFKWEKNLKNVSAFYSLNDNGTVKVRNEGFDIDSGKHKESVGKAKFVGDETEGALKVSFFGPFYSNYNVVQLDPNYQDVLIFGDNLDYLWILSREKTISEERKASYLAYAEACGYQTSKLTWTIQES